jgi:uroporphyrinogen-III synthase
VLLKKKARSVGFQNVIAAEGNVGNLKELILQTLIKKMEQLIYISGETISVDLDQQLTNEGYSVKRIVNYRSHL